MRSLVTMIAVCWLLRRATALADHSNRTVDSTFAAYREARLASDGAAAWRHVDRDTQEYYDRIVDEARTLDAAGFRGKNLLAQFMIARLRHQLDANELAAMTGDDFVLWLLGEVSGTKADAGVFERPRN
jgi:hypothetical protein